ncbi:hypothetical protein THAOC_02820, partial [Thalassiosira oceanica]
ARPPGVGRRPGRPAPVPARAAEGGGRAGQRDPGQFSRRCFVFF